MFALIEGIVDAGKGILCNLNITYKDSSSPCSTGFGLMLAISLQRWKTSLVISYLEERKAGIVIPDC